jgi:hypothetical protein
MYEKMDDPFFNFIHLRAMVFDIFVGRPPTLNAQHSRYLNGFNQAFRQQGCRTCNDSNFLETWHQYRHLAPLSSFIGFFKLSI